MIEKRIRLWSSRRPEPAFLPYGVFHSRKMEKKPIKDADAAILMVYYIREPVSLKVMA
jgi:hypothetical protein